MPAPVPPVASGSSTTTESTQPPETNDTELGTAALLQIASLCVAMSKQTKDSAVDRVKKAAIDELQRRGGVEVLLSLMSQQSSQASQAVQDNAANQREENRLKAMSDWQESQKEQRESQAQSRRMMMELQSKLISQLMAGMAKPNPTEAPNAQ